MFGGSVPFRISLTLTSITTCVLLSAYTLGLLPDRVAAIANERSALCESVALSCSLAVRNGDTSTIEDLLEATKDRNPDVLSIALRDSQGELKSSFGDHKKYWKGDQNRSTLTHMRVPIIADNRVSSNLELSFMPTGVLGVEILPISTIRLAVFVGAACLLGFMFYLRRVLKHLDPNRVIPEHVRTTLNSLAEGLLVLDRNERIVLANDAFAQVVGTPASQLQGHCASELPWEHPNEQGSNQHEGDDDLPSTLR